MRASWKAFAMGWLIMLVLLLAPCAAHAQGGPPFLTNDPGTPGDGHWEINLAAAQTLAHGIDSYQLPQFDFNYGVGERVQLTYEVPYVIDTMPGEPHHSGWSNAFPGVKWRFLDQGEDGWQLSITATRAARERYNRPADDPMPDAMTLSRKG